MDSNAKLKEINIKNRTCYYFDDMIKIEDFDFDVLFGEKKFYGLWHIIQRHLSKTLLVRFDKVDGIIRVFDGASYLVLFGGEKYDFIYNRVI